jgi:hypothetical protein
LSGNASLDEASRVRQNRLIICGESTSDGTPSYQQVDALWLIDIVLERQLSVPWSEQEREYCAEAGV